MSEFFTNDDNYEQSGGRDKCTVGQHVFEVLSAKPQTNEKTGKRSVMLEVQPEAEDGVEYRKLRLHLHPTHDGTGWGWTCSDIGKMTGKLPTNAQELERAIAQLNKGGYTFLATVEERGDWPEIKRDTIRAWGKQAEEETPF